MKTKLSIRWVTLVLFAPAAVFTAAACGSSSNSSTGSGGAGGTVIVGSTSVSSSTGTTSSSSSSTSTSGSASTSTSSSSSSGNSCMDADAGNCYSCPPSTNDQFLNACNGMVCMPYDNSAAHLPMLTADGGLPPITM